METLAVAPCSEVDPTKNSASPVFVHERGNRSLDGIFRLIEVAGQQQPLDQVLSAMCRDVAETAAADVVSIYVREREADGDTFTMRGNVGFPPEAVGRVRLRTGEGIVGFVAERMRPVSVDAAERDEHFKYVPGLGEERFPVLLAVPVVREGAAAGVLVLQRTALHLFNAEEVVLATALAAVISHALERAVERERERSRKATSTVARLPGVILSRGTAMGRAEILPTLSAMGRSVDRSRPAPAPLRFDLLAGRLREGLRKVDLGLPAAIKTQIACLSPILDDSRLGERLEAAEAARDPLRALSELAREYARVPFRTSWNDGATADLMIDRAAEIEDLCVLAHAAMSGQPLIRPGAIVVAEHLRVFLAVAAIAGGASAFVVEGDLPKDGITAEIVRSAGRPFLARVKGVFSWVRPDDLLVVDAEAGSLRVNPEATAVARFRNKRTTAPRDVP